jgi:hypothetical protein
VWMCGCMCVVRNHNLQHMCRVCLRAGLDVRVLCASKSDTNLGADEFDSRGGRLVEDEDGVELHAALIRHDAVGHLLQQAESRTIMMQTGLSFKGRVMTSFAAQFWQHTLDEPAKANDSWSVKVTLRFPRLSDLPRSVVQETSSAEAVSSLRTMSELKSAS